MPVPTSSKIPTEDCFGRPRWLIYMGYNIIYINLYDYKGFLYIFLPSFPYLIYSSLSLSISIYTWER